MSITKDGSLSLKKTYMIFIFRICIRKKILIYLQVLLMRKAKLSVIGEWQMLTNAFSLQDTIKIDRMSKVRHVKKFNTVQFHSKQNKLNANKTDFFIFQILSHFSNIFSLKRNCFLLIRLNFKSSSS